MKKFSNQNELFYSGEKKALKRMFEGKPVLPRMRPKYAVATCSDGLKFTLQFTFTLFFFANTKETVNNPENGLRNIKTQEFT